MRSASLAAAGLLLVLAAAQPARAADELPALAIEHYELPNGLDVILHEDHSTPIVAVNVWYHVGSKNEKPGRTGFAHLFEHMMFQGSEHYDDDYFLPLQKTGGQVNGSTTEDRTNYWENVPSDQLDLALYLEADRMGYLLPAMTEEKLANQKDVVKNEKRQGENQPYAKGYEIMTELLYPSDHPYSHTVIGSMDDLSAASLEDVSDFFRRYYAPNNASLAVAGDFDSAEAKALIEKYFAPIPSGPQVDRLESWIPRLDGERRLVAEDAVELPQLTMSWHTPGNYQPGDAEFDLLASVLAGGKTSRLYKRLVYEMEIAQDVSAWEDGRELSGVFTIEATAREGVALETIEAVIDEELAALRAKGVTKDELELAKVGYESRFMRRLQRVGAWGGKADLMNNYNTFLGDPNRLQWDVNRYRQVTPADVASYVDEYLPASRRAVLYIVPEHSRVASGEAAMPEGLPAPGEAVSFAPPAVERATLDNGLEIYVVQKHELPLVQVTLNFKSGWAADPVDRPGTAAFTAELLDEGTKRRDALQIAEDARRLGARLGTNSAFDGSQVSLNILRSQLDAGLELMGDVVMNASFPADEVERQRKSTLGQIRQENSQPRLAAVKLMQQRLFGEGHPYAQPMTGTGTAASVSRLTREDLVGFHATHYRPNNAMVVVVGDITLAEARAHLDKALGKWKRGDVPAVSIPAPKPVTGPRIALLDRPDAQQSMIVVGQLGPERASAEFLPFEVMNAALGGGFIARINMNLREDKGYTYGSYSFVNGLKGAGSWGCAAGVQTKFTGASLGEMFKEIRDIQGARPIGEQEFVDCKNRLVQGYPQRFETLEGMAGQLSELLTEGMPLSEWSDYVDRVQAMDLARANRSAREMLHPDSMQIVIVGDKKEVLPQLAEIGMDDQVVEVSADEL